MSDPQRLRRPELSRSEPLRTFSTLFGAPREQAPGAPPADAAPAAGRSLEDAITRSVELGYRVVDEYIRQGQRAAERARTRSFEGAAIRSEFEDVAMRLAQVASDFAATWLEWAELAGAARTGDTPVAPAAPSAAQSAPPERTRIRVELASRRAADVSLDLRPEARPPLVVHALRATDPEKPRIVDARLEPDADGALVLRVRVADDQPPGVYSGLVLDPESERPMGAVAVTVRE